MVRLLGRSRRAHRVVALATLALAAGCGSADDDAPGKVAVITRPPPAKGSIAFVDTTAVTLAPGSMRTLDVQVMPKGVNKVGFTLVGNPADGSLLAASATTDADGHASITLQAPSVAATFAVRASLLDDGVPTGVTAEAMVAVGEQGFGALAITPSYLGHRTITTWSASVSKGTCAALRLEGPVPNDAPGALTGTAPNGSSVKVSGAPVGPNLAVSVRAGHFAWGCADTTMVTTGDALELTVPVVDKPIDLPDASLDATFAYQPDPGAYAALLADGVSTLVDAFMPTSSSEGTIILNSMAAATSDAGTFATLRIQNGWDAIADDHFAGLPATLRDTCKGWATDGVASQPTTLRATLLGAAPGAVSVMVTQFGNLDAATAGVTAAPNARWGGQANDAVLFAGGFVWEPSRFAGASSLPAAQAAQAGSTTVVQALALAADCAGLATALGAFGSCDVDCVANLCGAGIVARWSTALDASKAKGAMSAISVAASAGAEVGDLAQPVHLMNGQWQGKITWGAPQMTLPLQGGTLTAD